MTRIYTPAQAVEATGLSLDTLRYYEREGLIGPVARVGGQRRYDDGDLAWIGVISCLREAGLGIADLQRFTRLLHSEADATSRAAFLRDRRAELVDHIARMNAALGVLDDKIAYYSATEVSA